MLDVKRTKYRSRINVEQYYNTLFTDHGLDPDDYLPDADTSGPSAKDDSPTSDYVPAESQHSIELSEEVTKAETTCALDNEYVGEQDLSEGSSEDDVESLSSDIEGYHAGTSDMDSDWDESRSAFPGDADLEDTNFMSAADRLLMHIIATDTDKIYTAKDLENPKVMMDGLRLLYNKRMDHKMDIQNRSIHIKYDHLSRERQQEIQKYSHANRMQLAAFD